MGLALVLATSAFAGEMHTGVTGPDPQPTLTPYSATEIVTTDGVMQTGEAASTPGAAHTVTEIAEPAAKRVHPVLKGQPIQPIVWLP